MKWFHLHTAFYQQGSWLIVPVVLYPPEGEGRQTAPRLHTQCGAICVNRLLFFNCQVLFVGWNDTNWSRMRVAKTRVGEWGIPNRHANNFKIVTCDPLWIKIYLWYAWMGKKQVRLALEWLPKASKSRTTMAMGSSSSSYNVGRDISLVLRSE